jgi:hypothetical protein
VLAFGALNRSAAPWPSSVQRVAFHELSPIAGTQVIGQETEFPVLSRGSDDSTELM